MSTPNNVCLYSRSILRGQSSLQVTARAIGDPWDLGDPCDLGDSGGFSSVSVTITVTASVGGSGGSSNSSSLGTIPNRGKVENF